MNASSGIERMVVECEVMREREREGFGEQLIRVWGVVRREKRALPTREGNWWEPEGGKQNTAVDLTAEILRSLPCFPVSTHDDDDGETPEILPVPLLAAWPPTPFTSPSKVAVRELVDLAPRLLKWAGLIRL